MKRLCAKCAFAGNHPAQTRKEDASTAACMNVIIIKGLQVDACVGVSDEERRNSQRLRIDAILTPLTEFSALADDISRTVDYHAAARRIFSVAASRPRRLSKRWLAKSPRRLSANFARSARKWKFASSFYQTPNTWRCAAVATGTLNNPPRRSKGLRRAQRVVECSIVRQMPLCLLLFFLPSQIRELSRLVAACSGSKR